MMLYRQSSAPVQARFQSQRPLPGRNQELNTRLQVKADELERLFAEHKRRPHGGGDEASSSSSSRGEFYERYMRKRDSKLRKEWGLKEEEMKALRESFERSTAELKLLQSLRHSSTTVKRDQLAKNFFSGEEEEEEEEQSDTCYRSVNSKLLPAKRTMSSSSVGRNSNSRLNRAIPRPSAKATAAAGGSARGSGSNSSDTRKENTKPPSTTNFPRSKSTSTGGWSSSSSAPSRKPSATPLKPLTVVVPKEQSGGHGGVGAEKLKPAVASDVPDRSGKAQSPLACISEAAAAAAAAHDVDVSSPAAASSGRTRKKWASVSTAGSDASCQPPRKDTGKGIKRFLQFGRKKKTAAESADAGCSPAAGGARDDREEDGAAASEATMSRSRLEFQVPCRGGIALERVQTRGSSMAAASPANCKLKEDQSPRGVPRSFFSLPPFRNREGDSKLGR